MKNKKIILEKKQIRIAMLLISIALMPVLITSFTLVQGQSLQNGTLFIVSYNTPTGQEYPQPFQPIHANNLTLEVYSPLTNVQTAHIHIKSYIKSENETRYLNQTFTILPRELVQISVLLPKSSHWQEITLTWDNVSVVYMIHTYEPAVFPFGNNPLGMLALIGIIMLMFTGLNIGITKAVLERSKYFPKLSQRMWLAVLVLTGLILYSLITSYYYDLTGTDWEIWLIPLWFFNFLMILNAWKSNSEETLLIHIRGTTSKDLETGLYAIRTATLSEKEKGKYNIANITEEYIDSRSYLDFIKRLLGFHIPINMEVQEYPDELEQVKSLEPHRQTKRTGKPWVLKDRKGKEHPFSKAYLIDPKQPAPALEKIQENRGTDKKGNERTRKTLVLRSHLNGKHMKEAEYFLSDYTTASESGKEIHRLSLDLAENQSALNIKAYDFNKEVIDQIFEIQKHKRTNGIQTIRTNPILERELNKTEEETPNKKETDSNE